MTILDALMAFLATPLCLYITMGILGALIGSFLNVVIYRMPIMLEREWTSQCAEFLTSLNEKFQTDRIHCEMTGQDIDIHISTRQTVTPNSTFNLMWPSSHCRECKHRLSFWQNIPILSYLLLQGRCHFCKSAIPLRYLSIEVLTAVTSVIVAIHAGAGPQLIPGLIFTWILIAAAFIDIDEQMLPDDLTLLGLWVGLLVSTHHVFVSPSEAIIGAISGYMTLWLLYWAFKLLTKKEGMGYGDFKLMACVGAWLGFKMLPVVVLISSFVGSVYGIVSILSRWHDRNQPMPFGPFIAIGAWISFLFGEPIMQLYLNWIH